MVFQSFNLFAHKTILDNITLGPSKVKRREEARKADQRGALQLLDRVGVAAPGATSCPPSCPAASSSASRSPARCAMDPKVMLFDEPT